jgi:hypothetical protein
MAFISIAWLRTNGILATTKLGRLGAESPEVYSAALLSKASRRNELELQIGL